MILAKSWGNPAGHAERSASGTTSFVAASAEPLLGRASGPASTSVCASGPHAQSSTTQRRRIGPRCCNGSAAAAITASLVKSSGCSLVGTVVGDPRGDCRDQGRRDSCSALVLEPLAREP